MYLVYGRRWLEVEGVVVVVGVVVREECGEVGVWCMLNIVIGWKSGWGMIWSWHAFRMVCCHTVLSIQMPEVSGVWYCVTLVAGGGSDVMMACWNVCKLSDFLSSPRRFVGVGVW